MIKECGCRERSGDGSPGGSAGGGAAPQSARGAAAGLSSARATRRAATPAFVYTRTRVPPPPARWPQRTAPSSAHQCRSLVHPQLSVPTSALCSQL